MSILLTGVPTNRSYYNQYPREMKIGKTLYALVEHEQGYGGFFVKIGCAKCRALPTEYGCDCIEEEEE